MKLGLFTRLARRNLKANQMFLIPFLLSSSIMFACSYILFSLLQNDYVKTRHENLPFVITIGAVVLVLLNGIFLLYGQSFIQKNRSKEFALYSVLGFEKKNIAVVLFIEQCINTLIISVLSTSLGYFLGVVMFKILNNILKDKKAGIGDYPFSIEAALIVVGIITFFMLILYLIQVVKIRLSNPVELMESGKQGQGYSKWTPLAAVIGLGLLIWGYYIALTTEGIITSFLYLFVAIVIVMAATVLIFLGLITFILRLLQKRKSYYENPASFLSISGMLYRIRSNALSLAGIAILCTGLILITGGVLTLQRGMEDTINKTMATDYDLDYMDSLSYGESKESRQEKMDTFQEVERNLKEMGATDLALWESVITPTLYNKKNHSLEPLTPVNGAQLSSEGLPYFIFLQTLENHNGTKGTEDTLGENEIIVLDNNNRLNKLSSLSLNGKEYQVKESQALVHSNVVVDHAFIIVKDEEKLEELAKAYPTYSPETQNFVPADIGISISFNMEDPSIEQEERLKNEFEESGFELTSKREISDLYYQLNGGFLFLGILIGAVLLLGTVLMIYYKQITEGFEDQENYRIMRQVGLPRKLTKKTIQKQIFWLFGLPLLTAIIHTLVAMKIVYEALGLLGVRNKEIFITSYLPIILLFILIYFIVYKITSRMYFNIVNS